MTFLNLYIGALFIRYSGDPNLCSRVMYQVGCFEFLKAMHLYLTLLGTFGSRDTFFHRRRRRGTRVDFCFPSTAVF